MLTFRTALSTDVDVYFEWTNDPEVRALSYNQNTILYSDHIKWFGKKIQDANTIMLLFQDEQKQLVGQVRLVQEKKTTIVSISIDKNHRGKGYASQMLTMAINYFLSKNPSTIFIAYIKEKNQASLKSFIRAGFTILEKTNYKGSLSYKLIYKND